MVPGFEFLQGLAKGAGAGLPGMGQWIAPTLDPAELDKRIDELRTVQFWLEQNARMLGTTIQALEVQRLTLTTLQTLNLPLAQIGETMKITPQGATAPAAAPGTAVDPLKWWGALTQQFGELAAGALKDRQAAVAATATTATAAAAKRKAAAAPRRRR
jgi:hypothetical protein